MKHLVVGVALLALAGCGGEAPAQPAAPTRLTAGVVADQTREHLGGGEAIRTSGRDGRWWARLRLQPRSTVDVVVTARPRAGSPRTCPEVVQQPHVESCEVRQGYAAPVMLVVREEARTFVWQAVSWPRPGLLREATLTITGQGDRDLWIEGEDLPGATLDQLIAIVTDPDLEVPGHAQNS